ncbi:MAG: TrkH family potassium uptake protein [Lachnospiraceae bacterium]|nr:TrkH family potassium uptake protein [Lachnospiraceae bacterium]
MNHRLVLYICGCILKFESAFLLLPSITGIFYHEFREALIYVAISLLCLILGYLCTLGGSKSNQLYPKEGFISVSLGWIVMSFFGALPFMFTGEIPSLTDALFETISGFTTTGASILTDVEALSHTSLFWRSFTHWIGGMGVFVFVMAILPMMGGSTMNLMKAESPGPSVGKLVPKVKDTAKILYIIYIFITVTQIIILLLCKLPLFDSMTLTFGTVGTGGFGIKNDSIAGYSSTVQNVITLFMILSGINYSAYFCLLCKQVKEAFSIEEVRVYLLIILSAVTIICFNTFSLYGTIEATAKHAFFQVGSIITTTGFATTDFNNWPLLSKTILVMLMFIGACAGSTGGGIKVSRITILFKTIKKELHILMHPRLVKKIKVDGHAVPHEVIRSTNVFIAVYFIIFFISLLLISVDNLDFTSSFTAVAATLNNIGPGLDSVGPTSNFSCFSMFSKYVLMFNMLAGRLEIFPMLILFHPACWKKY